MDLIKNIKEQVDHIVRVLSWSTMVASDGEPYLDGQH